MDAEPLAPESDDAKLTADADRLGLQGDERKTWFAASPRTRGLMKAREHRRLKAEARAHSINPERYLEMMPDEREEAMAEAIARNEQRRDEIMAKHAGREDGERVYSSGDETPATDPVPARRDGITVGQIVERVDDLFGDRAPRTLADIYARWPLGRPGGEEFYLRVERVQPKRFNGISVAGYLGEIRNFVVNEAQFGSYFGGEEYHVQLYGPDPKGKRDANNDPIIKALTDVINVWVPHRPPNLAVVPSSRPKQEKTMFDNPLGQGLPGTPQPAMSQADASIFKTAVDFVGGVMNKQQQQQLPTPDPAPRHVLEFLQNTTSERTKAAREEADARERIWSAQVEAANRNAERHEKMVEELKREIERLRDNGAERGLELAKLRDGDSSRLHDNYRIEIETLRSNHNEQIRELTSRHAEEIKRMEERLRDQGETHRQQMQEERRRRDDEEKRLREEIGRVREEERTEARRRLDDAKDRAEERLKDLEKQHASELRVEKSNAETRVQTEVTKMDYELQHLRERLSEKEKQVDELRTDLEQSKDPAAVIDKWTKDAKRMGFKKDEGEENQTFWQIVGKQAGMGLGQAIGNMDLGTVLGALKGAAAPKGRPQVPPGQQRPGLPPPAASPPAGPSRRANLWASQGAPVVSPAQQSDQSGDLGGGMTVGPEVPQTPPGQQAAQPQPQATPAQPQPAHPPPQPQPSQPPAQPAPPPLPKHRLLDTFGEQATFAFLNSLEQAINAAVTPEQFGSAFHTQYPGPSQQLIAGFQPEDAVTFVQAMAEQHPDALASPILREDGKKWLVGLWDELRKHAQKQAPDGAGATG